MGFLLLLILAAIIWPDAVACLIGWIVSLVLVAFVALLIISPFIFPLSDSI